MPTLVLPPYYGYYGVDSQKLWRAALDQNWKVVRASTVETFGQVTDPVLYGEPAFVHRMAELLGARLISPPEDWLAQVPMAYLRRDVVCTRLDDAYVLKYPAFVKPAGEEKGFPARVYPSGEDLRAASSTLDPSLPVLVSDPVEFEGEFRMFVLNRKIVTASMYVRDRNGEIGRSSDPQELELAVLFAHQLVYRMADCPLAFALDVGHIKGVGWAAVDASSCWATGLVGCDPAKVLDVLQRAVMTSVSLSLEL